MLLVTICYSFLIPIPTRDNDTLHFTFDDQSEPNSNFKMKYHLHFLGFLTSSSSNNAALSTGVSLEVFSKNFIIVESDSVK